MSSVILPFSKHQYFECNYFCLYWTDFDGIFTKNFIFYLKFNNLCFVKTMSGTLLLDFKLVSLDCSYLLTWVHIRSYELVFCYTGLHIQTWKTVHFSPNTLYTFKGNLNSLGASWTVRWQRGWFLLPFDISADQTRVWSGEDAEMKAAGAAGKGVKVWHPKCEHAKPCCIGGAAGTECYGVKLENERQSLPCFSEVVNILIISKHSAAREGGHGGGLHLFKIGNSKVTRSRF